MVTKTAAQWVVDSETGKYSAPGLPGEKQESGQATELPFPSNQKANFNTACINLGSPAKLRIVPKFEVPSVAAG